MRWLPAAPLAPDRRAMTLFAGAEVVLVMAIPFLAIAGYYALLDSKAGTIVETPDRPDPGWMALVEPSPVSAVVEVDAGEITGITLLIGHVTGDSTQADDPGTSGGGKPVLRSEPVGGAPGDGEVEPGGAVILVPGTLVVDGETLASRAPADAAEALSRALRLGFTSVDVLGAERWSSVLGDATYEVSNPDPITDDDGGVVLPVGPTTIGAADAPMFLGHISAEADPLTLLYRRRLFWSEVIDNPPTTEDPLAATIAAFDGQSPRLIDMPLASVGPEPTPDLTAAEDVVRAVVPIPAGAGPGDRAQVRILDRTGTADLEAVAAEVASTGAEVVAIGNASTFDSGPTQILVPDGMDDAAIPTLARLTGATTVEGDGIEPDPVVTLLVGPDFTTGPTADRSMRAG